jgi:hypothetical protein
LFALFATGALLIRQPAGSLAALAGQTGATGATANRGAGAGGVITGKDYHHDTSPALRNIPIQPMKKQSEHESSPNWALALSHKNGVDTVVQKVLAPLAMPGTILNFDGIAFPGVACNCAPPDTNGEVGATQYVQIVNEGFQVYNKTTGASVFGPAGITTLWAGFGGVCEFNGDGDPVVLYDQLANRWLVSQFAGASVPTDECVAVSTTSDATGTWNRYGFHLGTNFFDYPHLGVWPDAYYMSMNVFNSSGTAFLGPQPFAFDRAAMLAGNPATFVSTGITVGPSEDAYLPADLDGSTPPPAGAPNTFVTFPSTGVYHVYHFHADFATPANSTFTLFSSPAAAPFTLLCPTTRACVPEPNGSALDAIADRLMFRLAYRNFGDHESVVGNYTVGSGGVAGVRWFEMRAVTAGPVAVFQESTYQPDTTWRWMGSAAQDFQGNLAVGFSASSSSVVPAVRYAGRLATDPPNQLAQGEATLFAGAGSQTATSNRWGDYSDLTIDPVDDCTFWYTNEYYPSGSTSFNWRTRIGNFKFPGCSIGTPTPTVTGTPPTATPTSTATNTPTPTNTPAPVCTVSQGFDDITNLPGWFMQNNSNPLGTTGWFQGNSAVFPAQSGGPTAYIGANFNNTSGVGTISNWLLSPPLTLQNGAQFTFWTRTVSAPAFADRLQVRMSTNGSSTNVGSTATSVGDFTTLLLDINPTYTTSGYPNAWTQFTVTVSGLGSPTAGRIGFRYFVENGGPSGSNSDYIGIDSVQFSCTGGIPTATPTFTPSNTPSPTRTSTPTVTPTTCPGSTTFSENFDGVTAPALPAGWTATNAAGPAPLWTTSSSGVPTPVADSAPNAAFVDDPAAVSDKRLDSPTIAIQAAGARLTFRQNRDLESGFDGGVLEISINGGAFQDIVAAGGSFASGGYNGTISSSFSNPLAGRAAWTGTTSGAFVSTVVNLPAAAAGQNIQLRWRMGSDTSVSHQGWRIDTISIFECVQPTATPTNTPVPPTATNTPVPPTPTNTATPTPVPATARLVTSSTRCSQYASSGGTDLTEVKYGLNHGLINSLSPGTFLYFTRFTTTSPGDFSVLISQTNNQAGVPFFDVQSSALTHVVLYNANCTVSSLNRIVSAVNGQLTLNVESAPAAQQYILSVQYTTGNLAGSPPPNPPTVHYDFVTNLNGVPVNRDLDGLNLRKK